MKIAEFMNTELTRVPPDMDFATLLAKHASTGTRHTYVVDEEGRLIGVITNLDMLSKMVPSYLTSTLASSISDGGELILKRFEENKHLTAADVMQRDLVILNTDDTLIEANVRFHEGRYNAIPVVNTEGVLVGDIGRKEILRHIAADICGLPGAV
ncbi:MAG: CBS domain-containing protein [Humidesulfovibrio sp.]|uniref:CBS domain-containing protein n=1 Tax=Humidesulfovibrio sp. TaxID=2910988 RepID=UPI0027EB150F|nr:CBS domain-containing protein [Humidesulfovibrio sp.]MDQ7834445.1 CBS domain-containing protein [Humidesulfovibrio sp.]